MQELSHQALHRKKLSLQSRDRSQLQQDSKRSRFNEKQNNNTNSISIGAQNFFYHPPARSRVYLNTNLSRVEQKTNDQTLLVECGSDTDISSLFARVHV